MDTKNQTNYWNLHQQQWDALGSPLRPSFEDLGFFNEGIKGWCDKNPGRSACAFILGVTPELPALDWPEGSKVYGLDSSINMIKHIWPARAKFATGTVAMDWLAIPLVNESADIIIGDGCFSLISWPEAYRKLLASVINLLKQDGRLLLRFFVRPETNETIEQVFAELASGSIASFHSFKWRLAMAMQGNSPEGVVVSDIWNTWNDSGLTEEYVALNNGWSQASVHTIDAYKSSVQRLSFPTLTQIRTLLSEIPGEITCHIPQYELGDRCPIFFLVKKGKSADVKS